MGTTAVMSCVVFLVSKLVGLLYDFEAMASSSKASAKAASGETDAAFCRGAHCWRGAFTIGIMLSTAGLLSALLLTRNALKEKSSDESSSADTESSSQGTSATPTVH